MRIYLTLGHPDPQSFCGAIADAYVAAAVAAGHMVERQDLGALSFDPVLRHGYRTIQELEPDLERAQELIGWCERWVIVYPVWWGATPALLKGFFDRVMLPEFGFRPHEKGPLWDKLLGGRSAEIFTTSDAPKFYLLLAYRNSDLASVKTATLKFCGIDPVRVTRFGGIKDSTPGQRAAYLEAVRRAAAR